MENDSEPFLNQFAAENNEILFDDAGRVRSSVAVGIVGGLVGVFLAKVALLAYISVKFWPLMVEDADQRRMGVWAIVWLSCSAVRDLSHIGLWALQSYVSFNVFSSNVFLFRLCVAFSKLFNLVWFVYGGRLLFVYSPPKGWPASFAFAFWCYEAFTLMIPCVLLLLICFCMPCWIYVMVRMQVPSQDQRPTPNEIISKLVVRTFSEHMDFLKEHSGNAPPRPAPATVTRNETPSDTIIDSLRLLGVMSNPPPPRQNQEDSFECPICMTDFGPDDTIMAMPCDDRHIFHIGCVSKWLENSQACPICRANIVFLITNANGRRSGDLNSSQLPPGIV